MSKPINLTAGLKDVSGKGKAGQKFAIQIESDDLLFDPENKQMAAEVAQALAEQVREMLLQGRRPDGSALPGLDPDTVRWRRIEAGQGARGGEADERYKDPKFRARVRKNYDRDYTAKRAGKAYTPKDGGPRGVVSGMLADSFFARPNRDGRGVTIYVAAQRGRPRPGETISALEAVFGKGSLVNANALKTPKVQRAIQRALEASLAKSTRELLENAMDAFGNLQDMAEEAEE